MTVSYTPRPAGQGPSNWPNCWPNPSCPQDDKTRDAVRQVREALMRPRRGWLKDSPSPVCAIVRRVIGYADPAVVEGVMACFVCRDFLRHAIGTSKRQGKRGCR